MNGAQVLRSFRIDPPPPDDLTSGARQSGGSAMGSLCLPLITFILLGG